MKEKVEKIAENITIIFRSPPTKWKYVFNNIESKDFDHFIDALMDLHKTISESNLTLDKNIISNAITEYRLSSISLIKAFSKYSEKFYKDFENNSKKKLVFFGNAK